MMSRPCFAFCAILLMALAVGCTGTSGQSSSGKSSDADPALMSAWRATSAARAMTVPTATGAAAAQQVASFEFKPHRRYQRMQGLFFVEHDSLAAGDFTGDGKTDLVARPRQNQIELFIQGADGTLAPPLVFPFGSESVTGRNLLVVNDFNNDGVQDVAFATTGVDEWDSSGIGVLLSNKSGIPTVKLDYRTYLDDQNDWATLDFDGDGNQDIITSMNGTPYPDDECGIRVCSRYHVVYGDGRGGFGRVERFPLRIPYTIAKLETTDTNEDGRIDLVLSMDADSLYLSDREDLVMVAHALPGGGLSPPRMLHIGNEVTHDEYLAFADMNGDGVDDSMMGPAIHLRLLDGSYAPWFMPQLYQTLIAPTVFADFDGNGRTDMLNYQFAAFFTPPFLALYLQKEGVVQPPIVIENPVYDFGMQVSTHPRAFAAGDFNSDGCMDLAIAARGDGVVFLDGSNCLPRLRYLPDESGYVLSN